MLFVSILRSDRAQDPELWATVWQGQAPSGLKVLAAYNLQNDTRIFILDAESDGDIAWLDRINAVGRLTTTPAFDRTMGWQQALARDIEAFTKGQIERFGPDGAKRAELRRRAMAAPNPHAARRIAREWVASREAEGSS